MCKSGLRVSPLALGAMTLGEDWDGVAPASRTSSRAVTWVVTSCTATPRT